MSQTKVKKEICFPFENSFVCSVNTESIYEDRGTLIFLHGTLSEASMWSSLADLLADRYRCLALDFPGYGRSFSMETMVQAEGLGFWDRVRLSCELIDQAVAAGTRRIFLVGHEWGGAVAQVVALRRQQQVSGIILVNSRAVSQLANEMVLGLTTVLLKYRFRRLLAASNHLPPQRRQQLLAFWEEPLSRRAIVKALSSLERTRPSARTPKELKELRALLVDLSSLQCPVLLLWGREDSDLEHFYNSEELARLFLNAKSFFHESAGHWLHLDQPDWVASKIREFIFRTEQLSAQKAL